MPNNKDERLVASGREGGKQGGPSLPKLNVCGDMGLRIARDGTWFYEGTPINRMPLVRLFSTVLRREEDGFYLVTPVEKVPIDVEGEPFVAVEMNQEGQGAGQRLSFKTNVGHEVAASSEHRIVFRDSPEGGHTPIIELGHGLTARLARPVYYQLAELVVDGDGGPGVWSGGAFFRFPLDED